MSIQKLHDQRDYTCRERIPIKLVIQPHPMKLDLVAPEQFIPRTDNRQLYEPTLVSGIDLSNPPGNERPT